VKYEPGTDCEKEFSLIDENGITICEEDFSFENFWVSKILVI
jgi:hypothetical protein